MAMRHTTSGCSLGKCWFQGWYYRQHPDIHLFMVEPKYCCIMSFLRSYISYEKLKNKSRVVEFDETGHHLWPCLFPRRKWCWERTNLQSSWTSSHRIPIDQFSCRSKPGEFEKYLLCQIKIPRRIPASIWSESQNAAWALRCQLCRKNHRVSIQLDAGNVSVLGPKNCFSRKDFSWT